MRLVEVARLVNGVENWYALLQKGGCVAGALDPAHGAVRQPGRPHKVSLCGAQGPLVQLTVQHGIDDGCPHEQTVTHEQVDERFGVVEVRNLPGRALEPKGVTPHLRQVGGRIDDGACRQIRHDRAEPKPDAEPLAACGAAQGGRFVSGPRTVTVVLPLSLVTTISQWLMAIERKGPPCSLLARQIRSTNGESDDRSSSAKITGLLPSR